MSDTNEVLEKWERLKTVLEMTEPDVLKNARGNASAGNRARKGLRQLKKEAAELVKLTIQNDKARKSNKEE